MLNVERNNYLNDGDRIVLFRYSKMYLIYVFTLGYQYT